MQIIAQTLQEIFIYPENFINHVKDNVFTDIFLNLKERNKSVQQMFI